MFTLYVYRWHVILISLLLSLSFDTYTHIYPLYQSLQESNRHAEKLSEELRSYQKKTFSGLRQSSEKPLIPYLSSHWLLPFTQKITALSIDIKKLEKEAQHPATTVHTTTWSINLSGKPEALFTLFQTMYHAFPWLLINEPLFHLNGKMIDVSFQLIALTHIPNIPPTISPFTQQGTFPFCHTALQINSAHNRQAGLIHYQNREIKITQMENNS